MCSIGEFHAYFMNTFLLTAEILVVWHYGISEAQAFKGGHDTLINLTTNWELNHKFIHLTKLYAFY